MLWLELAFILYKVSLFKYVQHTNIYIYIYIYRTNGIRRTPKSWTHNSKNGHLTNNCRKIPLSFFDCQWWVHVFEATGNVVMSYHLKPLCLMVACSHIRASRNGVNPIHCEKGKGVGPIPFEIFESGEWMALNKSAGDSTWIVALKFFRDMWKLALERMPLRNDQTLYIYI